MKKFLQKLLVPTADRHKAEDRIFIFRIREKIDCATSNLPYFVNNLHEWVGVQNADDLIDLENSVRIDEFLAGKYVGQWSINAFLKEFSTNTHRVGSPFQDVIDKFLTIDFSSKGYNVAQVQNEIAIILKTSHGYDEKAANRLAADIINIQGLSSAGTPPKNNVKQVNRLCKETTKSRYHQDDFD